MAAARIILSLHPAVVDIPGRLAIAAEVGPGVIDQIARALAHRRDVALIAMAHGARTYLIIDPSDHAVRTALVAAHLAFLDIRPLPGADDRIVVRRVAGDAVACPSTAARADTAPVGDVLSGGGASG
ncbi:MAG: hypothetical protein J0M02_01255 [Planctomycetes bacterium]|nr:hypothetical protein [Planctomycetota bacterium]